MKTILIVEDTDINIDLLTQILEDDYSLLVAKDGAQGVRMAQENSPDLILMDVRMPRMTGYEACKVMKSRPDLKDIPIVFLTARGQESEIQQGLEAGAEEYLLKPFAPDQLTTRVKAILMKFGK